ncbi:MAG: aspartate kinase [Roseiflexaceae bacterium]
MRVLKFGGIAFADVQRMRESVKIVRELHRTAGTTPAVVCSALPGITDALLRAARAAVHGGETETDVARRELWNRHRQIAEKMVTDDWEREMLFQKLSELLKQLDRLTRAMATLGEYSPRGIDAIASLGERFAAHLVAVILRQNGVAAQMFDAADLIVTDDHFGSARAYVDDSLQRIRERLQPTMQAGIVPVVTGYTGATRAGIVTTLGRGGGDYTAALIGAALDVEEVCLWTDVNGILTADPKIVADAMTLPKLTYAEAAEMATLSGSEILHIRTLMPLASRRIPLRIANIYEPVLIGTIVSDEPLGNHASAAIISTRGLSLVVASASPLPTVQDAWTQEHASAVTTRLARSGIETLLVHQSDLDRTLMVLVRQPDATYTAEIFADAFTEGYQITHITPVALVSVISAAHGGALVPMVGLALGTAQIHPLVVARTVFGHYMSFVVPDDEVVSAVQTLHRDLQFHA